MIVLFCAGPILPALALDRAQSDLPECCRKNGVHMCSVRTAWKIRAEKHGNPLLRALCPFRSHAVLGIRGPQSFVPPSIALNSEVVLQPSNLSAYAGLTALRFFSPGNPKRGPPQATS